MDSSIVPSNSSVVIEEVEEFVPGLLTFSPDSFVNSVGGRYVNLSYDGRKSLCIQTPVVTCPFGFTNDSFQNDARGTGSNAGGGGGGGNNASTTNGSSNCVRMSINTDERLVALLDSIDGCIVDSVMERSKHWFDKTYNNKDVLLAGLFNRTVKQTKQYNPHITVRLKFDEEGKPRFGTFDRDQVEINIESPEGLVEALPRGTKARFILVSTCMWYISGRCGYSWDVLQIQIVETPLSSGAKRKFMFKN